MSNYYPALAGLTGGTAGKLDKIDGAILADGDAAKVTIAGLTYDYHLNATSGVAENSPYIIAPDTNPGDKRWELVAPVAPFSHVFATQNSGQLIGGSAETVIYNNESIDTLNEYDHTTGVFTAKSDGLYEIFGNIAWDSSASWSNDMSYTVATSNLGGISQSIEYIVSGNRVSMPPAYGTIELSAGDTLFIQSYQNSGSDKKLEDTFPMNLLKIDRIA